MPPEAPSVKAKDPLSEEKERFVLRMRGLPWECSEEHIRNFFSGLNIINLKIVMLPNGRSSGEGVVEFQSKDHLAMGLAKNHHEIDGRYIEIFKNTGEDMDRAMGIKVVNKRGAVRKDSHVIRVRGMPFATQLPAVKEFFARKGLKPLAIHFVKDQIGRPSGICYAEFNTREEQQHGLTLNREYIGARYVEIFQSSVSELERDVQEDLPLGVITGGLGAPSRDGSQIDIKKRKDPEKTTLIPIPAPGVVPSAVSFVQNPWGVILPQAQASFGYPVAQAQPGYSAYPIAYPQAVYQPIAPLTYPPSRAMPTQVLQSPTNGSKTLFQQVGNLSLPQQTTGHLQQGPIVYSQPLNTVNLPQSSYLAPTSTPLQPSTSVRYQPY